MSMSKPKASTPKREDMDKELETSEKYFDLSTDGPGDHTIPDDDRTMKSPRLEPTASSSKQDDDGKLTKKQKRLKKLEKKIWQRKPD